ncbi:MAG: LPS-assembly protein LptD [Oleiphilaceae bacterium]|nr:LPS-assembly protein LptD [Oleiphilaceae bacterium]
MGSVKASSRWLGLSLTALLSVPLQAEPPSAADMDWRPMGALEGDLRERTPAYCGGTYQAPAMIPPVTPEAGAVFITSDSARYRFEESLSMSGDVRIARGPFQARSDNAEYDQQSGIAHLRGSVSSRGEGFLLTGDSAVFDAESGDMRLNTASFLLHESHMRGQAQSLQRSGDEAMRINGAYLTTCQPGNNDWSLVASRVNLDQEAGFGTARHVRLQVRDVPVFYVPWMSFPIDDRRRSGLLYPSFGSSSADAGIFFAQPYYFNLAPHYDATFTPQYIHRRGLFSELEGRYLSRWGQTDLGVGFINSDNDFSEEFPGEDGRRWGLSLNSKARWNRNWHSELDYNAVSDRDYLTDLNRSLNLDRTTHLPRSAVTRYSGEGLSATGTVRDFQTLDRAIARQDRPYAQLPALSLDAYGEAGGLDWRSRGQYVYFWRDNTGLQGRDRALGNRLRLQPSVSAGHSGLAGFVRSSVMLDHSQYLLEDSPQPGRFSRSVPFVDLDTGLFFERDLTLGDRFFIQTLEPRLYYVYSPFREQESIPLFDTSVTSFNFSQLFARDRFTGGDRVGDNNRLTTAVTSRFRDELGLERARFSLGQQYLFEEQRVSINGRGLADRGVSPLAGEAMLRPLDNLSLSVAGQWDVEEERTLQGRSQLNYHSEDFRTVASMGHTYDATAREPLEQSDIGLVLPVSERTRLIGRWVYDMELEGTAGTLAGLEFTSCCWSLQLVAQSFRTRDDGLDRRVLFQIQLRGLGGGGSAAASVAEAIPGFEQHEPWPQPGSSRTRQGRLP